MEDGRWEMGKAPSPRLSPPAAAGRERGRVISSTKADERPPSPPPRGRGPGRGDWLAASSTTTRAFPPSSPTLDFRLWTLDFSTNRAYAQRVSMKKKALRTSLRSEAQATDSTWTGCKANRAATKALRHGAA